MVEIHDIINQINILKQQGLSSNQIIQTLERKGYSHTEIIDALHQSDLGGTKMQENPFQNNPTNNLPQMPNMTQNQPVPNVDPGIIATSNEELIETIIEEKWNDLIKDINKIITWKNRTEQKVLQMEQQVKDLKDQFDQLHKAIIGKVGEYDKNILNVGAEVKAMEKVFSNVLPIFVNNVKQLNDITSRLRVVGSSTKKTIKK